MIILEINFTPLIPLIRLLAREFSPYLDIIVPIIIAIIIVVTIVFFVWRWLDDNFF